MNEFELIQFLSRPIQYNSPIVLGIGDDAAILDVPAGFQLVTSIDTSVSGVHFPEKTNPYDIGYKSLAVSLSDMAAMGAEPIAVLLSLSLPKIDERWITEFARGFFDLAGEFKVPLIGGDTTRGPLSISTVLQGLVPAHQALLRKGARPGDILYVSGFLGDAGWALKQEQATQPALIQKLNRPYPRVALGLALRALATSAIDISDGLMQDLGHILKASQVGANIQLEKLPLSQALRSECSEAEAIKLALSAGDDYELCFTASPACKDSVQKISESLSLPLTPIGEIISEPELRLYRDSQLVPMPEKGYQHF